MAYFCFWRLIEGTLCYVQEKFSIDKCGVSQVVSHSRGKLHMTNEETSRGQTTFRKTFSIPRGESDES